MWWRICEQYGVRTMFSSPTGIRVLKKQDASFLKKHDLSKLHWVFLAGEPLDEPTAKWITDGIGKAIIDNYWQTETGWPVLSLMPGLHLKPVKFGSPGLPTPGYKLRVIDDSSSEDVKVGEKGVLVIEPPLPPGCLPPCGTTTRGSCRVTSATSSRWSTAHWTGRSATRTVTPSSSGARTT